MKGVDVLERKNEIKKLCPSAKYGNNYHTCIHFPKKHSVQQKLIFF